MNRLVGSIMFCLKNTSVNLLFLKEPCMDYLPSTAGGRNKPRVSIFGKNVALLVCLTLIWTWEVTKQECSTYVLCLNLDVKKTKNKPLHWPGATWSSALIQGQTQEPLFFCENYYLYQLHSGHHRKDTNKIRWLLCLRNKDVRDRKKIGWFYLQYIFLSHPLTWS